MEFELPYLVNSDMKGLRDIVNLLKQTRINFDEISNLSNS